MALWSRRAVKRIPPVALWSRRAVERIPSVALWSRRAVKRIPSVALWSRIEPRRLFTDSFHKARRAVKRILVVTVGRVYIRQIVAVTFQDCRGNFPYWLSRLPPRLRKSHLSRRRLVRQLQVLIWISLMGNCWAMDVNVAQHMTELAQAATRAAQAATAVAEKVSAKGGMSSGMESAAKVLKSPDVFNGADAAGFMGWKLNFETWMGYGDDRFNELLGKVERMDPYDSEQKSMENKFFAILSSYLRGRTNALVRSVTNSDKDGFKLWYDLCREYLPNSKQRTLSLAQTLAQYPQFSNKIGMLEQILNFEQLVGQYESSSGNTYPGDLKAATILRCSPQRISEYLQLSLKEDSSYADIREAVLAHERVTKGFSSESILKQIQTPSGELDTSMPMEVDRIFKGGGKDHKGKGKKGDFKGKGRGAFGGMPWGFWTRKRKRQIFERKIKRKEQRSWKERWWQNERKEQRT